MFEERVPVYYRANTELLVPVVPGAQYCKWQHVLTAVALHIYQVCGF